MCFIVASQISTAETSFFLNSSEISNPFSVLRSLIKILQNKINFIIKLKKKPTLVLIDGNKLPRIKNYKLNSIVKGDQKIASISAASIIAKVTRDKMITILGKKFKNYHWDKNCGYGTKQHMKAIKILGITSHHRKNFSPINKIK